jgi:hypothetical protein
MSRNTALGKWTSALPYAGAWLMTRSSLTNRFHSKDCGMSHRMALFSLRVGMLAAVAVFASGCLSTRESQRGITVEESVLRENVAILAVVDKCPSADTEQAAAALGPVIATAADFTINWISSYLENREKKLTGQFTARGLSKVSALSGCVIVGRGVFGPGWDGRTQAIDELTAPKLEALGFVDVPAFYLELNAKLEDGYLTLTPYFLVYGASSAKRTPSGKKSVTVALSVSAGQHHEDSTDSAEQVAKIELDLGKLEIGRYYKEAVLKGVVARGRLKSPEGNVGLVALVTESEEAGIAEQAVAKAFEDNSNELSEALAEFLSGIAGIDNDGDAGSEDGSAVEGGGS